MAKIKLTAAQEKAVYHGDGNLLISAAAGSGKTATLSGRIAELVTSGRGELSRMLIVTFTRASAGEMRERISRKLHEAAEEYRGSDPEISGRISRALAELPSAEISTIHSFLYKNLRPYFGTIGVPADARIAEQQVVDSLKRECMKAVVDDFFDGNAVIHQENPEMMASFTELADVIGQVRDTAAIDGELLWLADALQSCGENADSLKIYAEKLNEVAAGNLDPMETEFGVRIRDGLANFTRHYRTVLEYYGEELPWEDKVWEKYSENHGYMMQWIRSLDELLKDEKTQLERYVRLFDGYAPPRLGSLSAKLKTELSEKFKDHRDEMKKEIGRLAENYFQSDREETQLAAKKTARILRSLAVVLGEYSEKLTRRKRSLSQIDYNDLEEFATKLFLDDEGNVTETAREVGKKYDWIFIDEYQDTNRVQDRIFCAISGNAHRFIVGDIKQSIYRFRGANPEVFAEYRQNWTGVDGESVFMSENFRCDSAVIDFVNQVSRHTLGRSSIPYEKEDELVCGKTVDYEVRPVEVCLIQKDTESENKYSNHPAEKNPEAWYAAGRIKDMIGRYSPDGKSVLKPSDVAVILRSPSSSGQDYIDALALHGIPAAMKTSKALDEYTSVMLILCILRMVNNPLEDVSLAGALRSPVFGFTASELVELREKAGEMPLYFGLKNQDEIETAEKQEKSKSTKVIEWINKQQLVSEGVSVEKYLEQLIESCDIRGISGIRGNGSEIDAIRKLVDLAKIYENSASDGRNGIGGFLEYLESALSGAESGQSDLQPDCVQVISIHSSKGLEYPVVFLSECAKRRNQQDEQRTILYDQHMGLGMYLPDETGLVRSDNMIRRAVADKIRNDSIEEEMRMLYVALTRARNLLVVTAKTKDPEKDLRDSEWDAAFADEWAVKKSDSYLKWILQSCALCSNDKCFKINIIDETESREAEPVENDIPADEMGAQKNELEREFELKYAWEFLGDIPSKLVVSRLNPEILDEYDLQDNAYTEPEIEEDLDFGIPKFMSGTGEDSGRLRGSATHKFLQFVDFRALNEYGYETELNRLITVGFLSEKEAELINKQQILRFEKSSLLKKILRSGLVKREFRFNHRMSASDFTENQDKKQKLQENQVKITVQGVVDCVYRDPDSGKLVLVDYKTDALTQDEWKDFSKAEEKLKKRHRNQLAYYSRICSELFEEDIDEVYIYSTVLGRLIRV